MNDAPRQTLRELVARHGPGLCSDAKRCEGLLRDLCGAHRREINILVGALKERVPLDLLAGRGTMPRGLLLSRLAKRLEDQLALTEDAARWAVDSWALALRVVTEAELKEGESARAEAVAPPAPRPGAEGDAEAGKPAARTDARPAAPPPPRNPPPPPGRQIATPPPAHAAPPAQRRTSPPPATAQAPPPPTRANVPRASTLAARPSPAGPPSNATTTAPQQPGAGRLQPPSTEPPARRRGGRWRGCLVGCLLLILLSVLLFVGGPYVISVLREEQRQTGAETPPVQSP